MKPVLTRMFWDDQPGVTPGWYVEVRLSSGIVEDSEKIGFLADLDEFGEDDEAAARAAILEAYGIEEEEA